MEAPPIQYLRTNDGYDIAYSVARKGHPLVHVPGAFSHVQLFWQEQSVLYPWLIALKARFRLIQYDGRGRGLSTRGLSEQAFR